MMAWITRENPLAFDMYVPLRKMAAKLSDHNKVLLDLVSVCLVYIAIYLAYVSINYIVRNARIEKKLEFFIQAGPPWTSSALEICHLGVLWAWNTCTDLKAKRLICRHDDNSRKEYLIFLYRNIIYSLSEFFKATFLLTLNPQLAFKIFEHSLKHSLLSDFGWLSKPQQLQGSCFSCYNSSHSRMVAYPLWADQGSHNAHVGGQKQLQPHD